MTQPIHWPILRKILARRRAARRRTRRALGAEALEARVVLDARLLITELVASNDEGLEDENGDANDWIEIHNAGDGPANLDGWHLTDDDDRLTKWTFPAVTIEPDDYLVVFTSGKDRIDPARPLHTNFQLDADGEYLALVQPDGRSVASQFAPRFPSQSTDDGYGWPQDVADRLLLGSSSEVRVFVPTASNGGDQLGLSWTQTELDDSSWLRGHGAVGFEDVSGYEELLGVDIKPQMLHLSTSAYLRYSFDVPQPRALFSLTLRVKYDDGFVVFLNGTEVARQNAPELLNWDSAATISHVDSQAVVFEDVDLTDALGLLRSGTNLLAVQGLNRELHGNDFLIDLELHAGQPQPITAAEVRYFAQPSPGSPNGLVSFAGAVDDITASTPRGFYEQPIDVAVRSSTPGATLVYTTDGSLPSLSHGTAVPPAAVGESPAFTLRVDRTTTLRVRAFKDDFIPSRTGTFTYLFVADIVAQDVQANLAAGFPPTWRTVSADYGMDPDVVGPNDQYQGEFARKMDAALKAIPSISVVMEMDDLFGATRGIYANSTRSGADWERPTSVEVIDPGGAAGFQIDAGIRIQGDNVRNLSNSKKQSFRLEFREQYGPTKLRYPLFGDGAADSFDTIILRGQYNDGWVHTPQTTQYLRDEWARTTQLAMGHASAHGRYMHVYLNGFYWGLYDVVERPEASFSATYNGGDKDEWDTLNTGALRSGSYAAWSDLIKLSRAVNTADQTASNAALQRLLGKAPDGTDDPAREVLLDLENYIDYLIVNFYGGNVDWPGRNYYAGRRRGPDSEGFQFYAWDTEKILDHGEGATLTTDRTGVGDGVAQFYRSLLANDEFRLIFADRVQRHFSPGGVLYVDPAQPQGDPQHPQRNQPAARYAALAQQIELPLAAESARWGDTQTPSTRNDGLTFTPRDWRAKRDDLLTNFFPRRSAIVLQQFIQAGLYPSVAAPEFNQHGGRVLPGFPLILDGPGPVVYTLDGSDPRQSPLLSGVAVPAIAPGAQVADAPVNVDRNVMVKARTLIDGQWSALAEASFTLTTLPLRISEIMYHPRDAQQGAAWEDDDFEFVELVNMSSTEPINLAGVAFTRGIEFRFPAMMLEPGARCVVVRSQAAFETRYGGGPLVAGQYGGTADDFKLNNAGELLRLEDPVGQVIHEFAYDDGWIPSTDGPGDSLMIVDPTAPPSAWNDAANWRAGGLFDGSPGRDDAADLNGDRRLDAVDIAVFSAGLCGGQSAFDYTHDGRFDDRDAAWFVRRLAGVALGDSNLDGIFDATDLLQVFRTGQYEDGRNGNSSWSQGDWNCDGDFDSSDIILAWQHGGILSPTAAGRSVRERPVPAVLADALFMD